MNILCQIGRYQSEGKKFIIYCAGLHGRLFYELLRTCGVIIDYFSDIDSEKWGKRIVEGVFCICPDEVRELSCAGVICVGRQHYTKIRDFVFRENLFEIIEISEVVDWLICERRDLYFKVLRNHAKLPSADLLYDLEPNSRVLDNKGKKTVQSNCRVAVYTAVFDRYDAACFPQYVNREMDYFYVSDTKPDQLPDYFQWLDAKNVIPDNIVTPVKRNRYLKMHPHLFLQNYDYSIYVDGNIIIKADISGFVRKSKSGIAVFAHPQRECVYYEALSIVNFKRVNVDDVCRQMEKYFAEGMPYRYGLTEMPLIVREHGKKECIAIMETWWKEFDTQSQRDQLSFMYALWKNNLCIEDLAILGNNVRECKELEFCKHIIESRNVKNEGKIGQ